MSAALQPNMRNPKIAVEPFSHIINDYLGDVAFKNTRVLDIGPGQCDFLDLAKKAGAAQTCGLDYDPAVGELGQRRGHEMTTTNLREGWPYKGKTFDGIFCRGSINCCWFTTGDRLTTFLNDMAASLSSGGWLWIAPWNNPVPGHEDYLDVVHRLCTRWAKNNTITIEIPPQHLWSKYGIGYSIPRVEIWHRP